MAEEKKGMANGSQMRITEDEIALIKATFSKNEPLLKLMRKMFLPELDPKAPIGQMIDIYATIKTDDRDPIAVTVDLMARNKLIAHLDGVLMQFVMIGAMERLTPEEAKAKLKADGSK